MMAGSREAEVLSVQELQPLREAIAECIEQLDEQDRFIVDAINSEVISLEELGRRLGVSKPHAWRLRNRAYDRLKLILLEHPLIRERLGIYEDEADNGGI
jgi:DNA-directed RNA polymerase specialized sigma subunit